MNLMETFEGSLRAILDEVLAADLAHQVTQRVMDDLRPALERALADFAGLPAPRPAPRGRPPAVASGRGPAAHSTRGPRRRGEAQAPEAAGVEAPPSARQPAAAAPVGEPLPEGGPEVTAH